MPRQLSGLLSFYAIVTHMPSPRAVLHDILNQKLDPAKPYTCGASGHLKMSVTEHVEHSEECEKAPENTTEPVVEASTQIQTEPEVLMTEPLAEETKTVDVSVPTESPVDAAKRKAEEKRKAKAAKAAAEAGE